MLTPHFKIEQDDLFIILEVVAPYTKVSEVEVLVEDKLFTFYAKPYYLRLEFLHRLEDEGSVTKYICDDGKYEIKLKKAETGLEFKNLDLLTTLLQKPKNHVNPSIEVLNEGENTVTQVHIDLTTTNWLKPTAKLDQTISQYGYGFANKKTKVLSRLQEELPDVVCLQNPDQTNFQDRTTQRELAENNKFDMDYYLADLYDTTEIKGLLKFKSWWHETTTCDLNAFEKDRLQKLPNKQFLLNYAETVTAFLGLVDIIFAYCYDVRCTEGDNENVESAWTIRTVSPTLSWCDTQSTIPQVLKACYRRALSYPQYRHWKLTQKVLKDVVSIFCIGRRCVLKCLLSVFDKFQANSDSPSYILNDLYIQDYCIWIQKVDNCDVILSSLASAIKGTDISKSGVDLEIDYIEEAARLVLEEESHSHKPNESISEMDLVSKLQSVTLDESAQTSEPKRPLIVEIPEKNV